MIVFQTLHIIYDVQYVIQLILTLSPMHIGPQHLTEFYNFLVNFLAAVLSIAPADSPIGFENPRSFNAKKQIQVAKKSLIWHHLLLHVTFNSV